MIHIIDYNCGNIASIANMLKKAGSSSTIVNNPEDLYKAKKIILPGVGAFDYGIKNLTEKGLDKAIIKKVLDEKIPILGICLGMQLLMNGSEEGILPGLGLINGNVKRFKFEDPSIKVPHMGWQKVDYEFNDRLIHNCGKHDRYYFVHSYYVNCHSDKNIFIKTIYGNQSFASGICENHIYGVQFHPEKSHRFGLALLKGFIDL